MPDETYQADLSKRRGQVAAGISDPAAKKAFIADQGSGKKTDQELETGLFGERNRQAVSGDYDLPRKARQ